MALSFSDEIKNYALDLGYCKVGITSTIGFEGYRKEVESRGEAHKFLINNAVDISRLSENLPKAKSIIVLAWDYMQNHYPENLSDKIGRVFLSRSYNPPANRIHGTRLQLLKDFLAEKGCNIIPNVFVPLRYAAAKAGIVNFGKNSFAYVDSIGSFVSLFAIVVDTVLEYDVPSLKSKCPPNCTICQDACPTKSICESFKMIPAKCIAFNTYMSQNGKLAQSDYIPFDMREKIGQHIYGCDICQEVCPRNASRLKMKLPKDAFLEKLSKNYSLPNLLHASDDFFRDELLPIVYNFMTDKKYIQRNAAIAMGNSKDKEYIPDLEMEINNPEETIRAHVVWALGQIGGNTALDILKKKINLETSKLVLEEIKYCLQK